MSQFRIEIRYIEVFISITPDILKEDWAGQVK